MSTLSYTEIKECNTPHDILVQMEKKRISLVKFEKYLAFGAVPLEM